MRVFIIATSAKPRGAELEIEQGKRGRLEYVELSRQLNAPYVDYDAPDFPGGFIRRLEEKSRLDFYWAWKLARQIRARQPDVVLSMSERVGIPLGLFLNRRIRHVVIMHHALSPLKLRLMQGLHTAKRWDRVLTFSEAEAGFLRDKLGVPQGRVMALKNPVDTQFYRQTATHEPEDYIFSLGLSYRDYPTLMSALTKLPHVVCQVSATSAWVSHEAIFGNQPIPPNVQLKDYNHPTVIREAYAGSRFVVIPIQKETTQWSAGAASVLQAQAMGKAVIATRMPGLSDYVRDNETGLLVEGNDPDAMAAAIDDLWRNPDKAAAMGQCAQEWVRATFSIEQWMDNIRAIMAETL